MSCCTPAPSACCTPAQLCGLDNFGLQFPSLVGPMGPPGGAGAFFENYAALRVIDATVFTAGYIAWVSGYSTTNDGGGGNFAYDPLSVVADDDGTVLSPANGVGRWVRVYEGFVDVKWYGATGDGVTNDTASIQATIATGLPVFIPEGTYLHSGLVGGERPTPLFISGAGITSVLQMDGTAAVALTLGQSGVGLENIQLQNFCIRGHANSLGGIKLGEHAKYIAWFKAINVQIDTFQKTGAYCVQLNNTQEVEFNGCVLKDAYDIVQRPNLGSCTSTLFSGSSGYIGRATHRGVELLGRCADITFNNQIIESTELEAVYSVEDSNVTLRDCYFEDNCGAAGQAVLYLTGPAAFLEGVTPVIAGCHFHEPRDLTKSNLKMDYTLGGLVTSNTNLWSAPGVVTTANTQCHFSDNYIRLVDFRTLLGNVSCDDYDLQTDSRYAAGNKLFHDGHFYSRQSADATATIHANAGTGATVVITPDSNDTRGAIFFTPGSGAWVAGKQFTVNFAKPRAIANYVVLLYPVGTSGSAIAVAVNQPFVDALTSTGFDVHFTVAASSAVNQYWVYLVFG